MVLDMVAEALDNPAADLVAALVLIIAGAVHIFNPTASTVAMALEFLGATVSADTLIALAIRFVGIGVAVKGFQMAQEFY